MSDTIYDVILYPDPVLKEVANPIGTIDAGIEAQADKMLGTMYASKGIGLAANQVNILNRMFVMDVDPNCWHYKNETDKILKIDAGYREGQEQMPNPVVMINPQIVKKSERKSVYLEGCLSVPQQYADVERPAHVTVEYIDIHGDKKTMEASGLESHCIQHELDHLDGILFIDYLSRLKRGTLIRKLEKYKKAEGLL
jgi:peptide deformylase